MLNQMFPSMKKRSSSSQSNASSYEDPDTLQVSKQCVKMYFPPNERNSTELFDLSDLKVKILKSKLVSNGFFKKDTFRVGIATGCKGWKVVRTYEDFKWLHACLHARFAGNYIVELPRISVAETSKDSDEFFLCSYLNQILKSKELLYSPELVEFLKLNEKDFMKAKGVC